MSFLYIMFKDMFCFFGVFFGFLFFWREGGGVELVWSISFGSVFFFSGGVGVLMWRISGGGGVCA